MRSAPEFEPLAIQFGKALKAIVRRVKQNVDCELGRTHLHRARKIKIVLRDVRADS